MAMIVSARAVRELISEGDYMVESIEQREHGRVGVTLALRSRAQPCAIHIETGENKLAGLFRALLNGEGPGTGKRAMVTVGSQSVPVVQVEGLPADRPQRRRRRVAGAAEIEPPKTSAPGEALTRTKRRRSAIRQLVLVPQETRQKSARTPQRARRRAGSKPSLQS
jgi:hypothetical protein